jgi:hypothetical protein
MNLHLRYKRGGIVLPDQKPRDPYPATIQLHYAICDEDGHQLETMGGRYESDYTDSYQPHREERAMLDRLQEVVFANEAAKVMCEIITVPNVKDLHRVLYEAVLTMPYIIEFGDIELK